MDDRTRAARLEGRVAIVTGSARGIGLAIARAYAAEGAHVVGVDVLAKAGEGAAAEILAEGGSAAFVAADVSRETDVRRVVAGVLEEWGRVDILVNNAAVQVESLAADVLVEDFHRIVDVNLLGCVLFCREVLPAMVAQRGGAIVNMSSVNAFAADPLLPVYGATKAAIIGYTKSIAVAYGPHGIRANAICPGDVDTELNQAFFRAHPDPVAFRARVEGQYPVRRIASPEEIARVAVFLASDDATFVSGTEVVVDGAITARIYEL
ncbi:MAG TPA: SDR family oxidoreductase [Candidatus Limnocylindrales bacterium]|nr:SDR family oxidoreductase [Candidatus Limnocylindrales bacterium]